MHRVFFLLLINLINHIRRNNTKNLLFFIINYYNENNNYEYVYNKVMHLHFFFKKYLYIYA